MMGLFDRMLGRNNRERSANTAKQRLQFVLVHDRINLPPERLQEMKTEILAVISKYVSVNDDSVEIALQQRDNESNLLIAEVPFSRHIPDAEDDDFEEGPFLEMDESQMLDDEEPGHESDATVPSGSQGD